MNMENWKLGVSSGAAASIDRWVFESYRENGIELMEISLPYEKYAAINWRETAKNANETNSICAFLLFFRFIFSSF